MADTETSSINGAGSKPLLEAMTCTSETRRFHIPHTIRRWHVDTSLPSCLACARLQLACAGNHDVGLAHTHRGIAATF
ncbi:uncharacterized protein FTOL_09364 [Fusarium torulosum]|uniref:Uncharacterized protein n=1 Tax=Fusarium torulosum TaxID=33205 RepID=A0AAE8MEX2_9HYPO|nr:uncharacterized protein FTOL_09364 [Fusarium torulosum]